MLRILFYSAVLAAMAACGESSLDRESAEPTVVDRFMADPNALARGQAIFEGSCASFCHAIDAEAGIDSSFLFDCQWTHASNDQEIFDVVTNGIAGTRMVGFGNNFPEGDDDLWKVIAYLRSEQQAC